jgi:AraC family transcriptional regulator, arabinose operon regulatory protein
METVPVFRMHIAEGFEGQTHFVIPRHFLQQVENHPLLHALFPTDIGWFPQARYHYRERPEGAPEHILIYCAAGSGWARVDEQIFPVAPGQAMVIPSGKAHVYSASLDDPWSIHWVHFRGETAYQFIQQLTPGQYVIPVHPKAQVPIVETFEECYAALTQQFAIRQMIFCALAIHRILAWLFFANPAFQPGQTEMPKAIDKALTFMRDQLYARPSLQEMAAHVGLSISYFSSLFKAHMGESPVDYFIHLKMQYACFLLETSEMPVKDIAFTLAYDDPYYFSRLFRKVIGTSPQNYREGGI